MWHLQAQSGSAHVSEPLADREEVTMSDVQPVEQQGAEVEADATVVGAQTAETAAEVEKDEARVMTTFVPPPYAWNTKGGKIIHG
jgi:hypothetical protein